MKDIRDRLKIVNVGKGKDDRYKTKSSKGVVLVQNKAYKFIAVSKMSQVNTLHPL